MGVPLHVALAVEERQREGAKTRLKVKQGFVVRLIQLGDPKAIPTLRAAYARATKPGLRTMLRWALDSCRDPWLVDELQRMAASASETEAAAGASMLSQREQIVRW